MKERTNSSAFDVTNMLEILRHKESRICRGCDDTFPTQASQVHGYGLNYKVSIYFRITNWKTMTLDVITKCAIL